MSSNNFEKNKHFISFSNENDACDQFSYKNTKQSIQNNGEIILNFRDLALFLFQTISANVTVKIVN